MATALKVLARDTAGRAIRAQVTRDSGIKVGDVRLTGEGYMIAEDVPVARTGVQEYSALELGLDASMKTVRLYRPPAEVFSAASMATLDRKPVTYYHPEKGVDASNWKATAVGRVETPSQDGDFLDVARFEVNDGETVQAIAFGVKELSCGYTFTPDMTPGTTPAGEAYDGVMRQIEHNHVAIVYQGRCGSGCAVGDCAGCGGTCGAKPHNQNGDSTMATRTINLGKLPVTLDEKDATIVEAHIEGIATARDAATKRATDAETALAAQGEAMKKLATDNKAALDAAEAKVLKPEQVAAMVSELSAVAADAVSVLPEYDAKGKTAAGIRVEVLSSLIAEDGSLKTLASKILGGAEPAKASDVLVRAAFDAIVSVGAGSNASDGDRDLADALVGDSKRGGTAGKPQKLSGRALMVARSRGQVTRDAQRQ